MGIEKELYLVGATKIYSKEKDQWYYKIDYVDKDNNVNKTLIKKVEDFSNTKFEKIKAKVKSKDIIKVIGIFQVNSFDKLELDDMK